MSEDDYINNRLAQSIKSLEETEEIASAINTELYNQREKLERTRNRMDRVNQNLKQCENTTYNITSFWKNFVSFFTSSNNQIESSGGIQTTSNYNPKPSAPTCAPHEKTQVEKSPHLVSIKVSNLKSSAVSMGRELDHQNQLIDDISQSVNTNDERLKQLDKKITKLL